MSSPAFSTRRNVYDLATGQQIKTEQLDTSGNVTAKIVRGYDSLGRLTSYTDAAGNVSATTYDIASRPQVVSDDKGTQTYAYDDYSEGSSLLTQVTDSQAGTFTGTYSADGQLQTEQRPDGLTVNHYYNEEGAATGIEYLAGETTVYDQWVGLEAHGTMAMGNGRTSNGRLPPRRHSAPSEGRPDSLGKPLHHPQIRLR